MYRMAVKVAKEKKNKPFTSGFGEVRELYYKQKKEQKKSKK